MIDMEIMMDARIKFSLCPLLNLVSYSYLKSFGMKRKKGIKKYLKILFYKYMSRFNIGCLVLIKPYSVIRLEILVNSFNACIFLSLYFSNYW